MLEEDLKLNEAGTDSIDIAQTDQNLTIDDMFQQNKVDSLARKICSISTLTGPSGALFNIKKKPGSDSFVLVRKEVEVFPSVPIKTEITKEAIYDMLVTFGKEAPQVIGKMLRGLANEQENSRLFEVLEANSKDAGDLQLEDDIDPDSNFGQICKKVQNIVLKMNQKNFRTYEAFCILPYYAAGAIMHQTYWLDKEDSDSNGLYITTIGKTKYYLNPNVDSTTAYIGLKDTNMSKSSLVFSPYQSEVAIAINPDNGNEVYRIFNRFAITPSPLNETDDEMLYKFNILV